MFFLMVSRYLKRETIYEICSQGVQSLLLCLNEHTFHPLAVNARCIQRVLADIVAVSLKTVNNIQIDNLRPVDTHEVRQSGTRHYRFRRLSPIESRHTLLSPNAHRSSRRSCSSLHTDFAYCLQQNPEVHHCSFAFHFITQKGRFLLCTFEMAEDR